MNLSSKPDTAPEEELCLKCGLCCNGVLFSDVRLQPGDNPARLRSLGLRLDRPRPKPRIGKTAPARDPAAGAWKFQQPCAALDGCRCRIYTDRPKYCRQFDCALLKDFQAGRIERKAALRVIHDARENAEKVRVLLRELGDTNEEAALSARFRQTARRMEESGLSKERAAAYGQLTLAVHNLNYLLSQSFYP